MNKLQNLFPIILGFVVIVLTLAMAPSINTANAAIQSANLTNLTGMSVMDDFGAPLIIFGLLASGGLLAVGGIRGKLKGASVADMLGVIGAVVIAIIALTFMTSIITYTNTLIGAVATGFDDVLYGVIPLLVYVGIIAGVGWTTGKAYRSSKGKKAKKSPRYGYGF
jgi:hypothetical protein